MTSTGEAIKLLNAWPIPLLAPFLFFFFVLPILTVIERPRFHAFLNTHYSVCAGLNLC